MKRNDWMYGLLVLGWSLLFYRQVPGLNMFVFDVALVLLLALADRARLRNGLWCLAAAGTLVSGACMACYGNALSCMANVVSMVLLAAAGSRRLTAFMAFVMGVYSVMTSCVFMFIDWSARKRKSGGAAGGNDFRLFKRIAVVVMALMVTVFFFFLYRGANSLFDNFTRNIRIDFISWRWLLFTYLGMVVVYGLFYFRDFEGFAAREAALPSMLDPAAEKPGVFDALMSPSTERFAGTVLLVLLNLLLLTVNLLDATFLFGGVKKLPDGVSYADFIHEGTALLIVSIICAMSIILFFFRGRMNFDPKAKHLRTLALLWVAQNAFLVFSSAMRNQLYIEAYALTYKRIGIYVYLLLSLIGLFIVVRKLAGRKTNVYLFRAGGWSFYAVLVLACIPDYDRIIADYNTAHSKQVDNAYLASLSCRAWPVLLRRSSHFAPEDSGKEFHERVFAFMAEQENNRRVCNWPSLVLTEQQAAAQIRTFPVLEQAHRIDLRRFELSVEELPWVPQFACMTQLDADNSGLRRIGGLAEYARLRRLSLAGNALESLAGIEKLSNLEELDITDMAFDDITPLLKLPALKILHADKLGSGQAEALKAAHPALFIDKQSIYARSNEGIIL